MTPQNPAEGIYIQKEFNDAKFYKVPCSCGNSDDDIEFVVESEDWGEISVHTYTIQKTSWWDNPFKKEKSYSIEPEWLYHINYYVRSFLNSLAHRLNVTWKVWTKGYVKYSQTIIMSKQQALNYADTLNQAVKDLDEFRRKHKKDNNEN